MYTTIYLLLMMSYFGLFIWGILLFRRQKHIDLTVVLLLVIFGLIYDNFILSMGRVIGEGQFLLNLTYLRFWFHALFTPLLIIFVWKISEKVELKWAKNETSKMFIVLLTIGLIIYEWYQAIRELKLEPKWEQDVLMYESTGEQGLPIMVLITTFIVGWVGVLLWKHQKYRWLFIGTAAMVVGSILGVWFKTSPIMNIFELIFILSLLLMKKYQIKRTSSPFA
ncbi:MAG: hypothetical protein GX972_07185 [Amphibacillus sp.]|nr:hypothetical protein [Amphibacillus sp.]